MEPPPLPMRLALALAALLAAAPAAAQTDRVLWHAVRVDAYAAPTDRGVWTDMRPLSFKGSDEELQAVDGATLYAGPSPRSAAAVDAWRARSVTDGRVDCEADDTLCMVHVSGRGDREALVFPVRANVHGLPQAQRYRVVPELQLSDEQAEALADWLGSLDLVLGDGNALTATRGARLVTSRADRPDCGDPAVTCGVVFEVETTDLRLGLF